MCLMNIDCQHYDLEGNLSPSTVTLGSQDCLIRFKPVPVNCCNEITCFGCVFVNTMVENEFDGFGVQRVSCDFRFMVVRSVSCDMSSFSCYNIIMHSHFQYNL